MTKEGGICGPRPAPGLPDEVRIAGGVDEVDHHTVMGERGNRELHGALIEDRLGPIARGRRGNEMLEQCRLAASAVPDEHHIADVTGGSGLLDWCARGSLGAHGENDVVSGRWAQPRTAGRYAGATMLNRFARAFVAKLFTPLARLFLKLGLSPDVVTIVGTIGVCVGALGFYPRHEFFWGSILVSVFALSDTIDGVMARLSGRSSKWGAYLDSTLDRVGDSAVFGGLVLWYAGDGGTPYLAALALACLILGSVVSYSKARAEGLGMTANVGIAERADRLVAVLIATGLVGLGVPEVLLTVVLALLALASLITVIQRMLEVRRQAFEVA